MSEIQFNFPKRKRFSSKVMDFEMKFGCSEGMMKAINKYVSESDHSIASFMRELVMNKLNIDEHGKPKN